MKKFRYSIPLFLFATFLLAFHANLLSADSEGKIGMVNETDGTVFVQTREVFVDETFYVTRDGFLVATIEGMKSVGTIGMMAQVIPKNDVVRIKVGDNVSREKPTKTLPSVPKFCPVSTPSETLPDLEHVLDFMVKKAKECKDYQCTLIQEMKMAGTETKMQSQIFFKQPDKYRAEMDMGPSGKMVTVLYEKMLWQSMDTPEGTRYMKWDMEKVKIPGMEDMLESSFGMFTAQFRPEQVIESMKTLYELQLSGMKIVNGTEMYVVDGTLKKKSEEVLSSELEQEGMPNVVKTRWWIGKEDGFVYLIEGFDDKDEVVTRQSFTDVQFNTGVADKQFVMHVPEGAEVIDMAELMEEMEEGCFKAPKSMEERIAEKEVPEPPKTSLLVCNFGTEGDKDKEWVGIAFARMLAAHLHYAPKELMYQPCDGYYFRVMSCEDKLGKMHIPNEKQATDFGKRLGVANVLLGKVKLLGDKASLEIKLLKTSNGELISQPIFIESEYEKLSTLSGVVAPKIAELLGISLTPEQKSYLSRPLTKSIRNFETVGQLLFSKDEKAKVEALKKVVRENPQYEFAHVELIGAYRDASMPDEATSAVQRAVSLFKNHSRFKLLYAVALAGVGKVQESEQAYVKLAEYDPGYFYVYMNSVDSLFKRGRVAEGLTPAKKELSINPASAEARITLALVHRARAFESRSGRYFSEMDVEGKDTFGENMKRGLEQAEMACKIDPKYAHAYKVLISLYCENSMGENAESAFHKVIALCPDDIDAYKNIVWHYRPGYSNQPEKAYAVLERAIKENAGMPKAYFLYIDHLYWEINRRGRDRRIKIDVEEHKKKIKELRTKAFQILDEQVKQNPNNSYLYRYYAERILVDLEKGKLHKLGIIQVNEETKKMIRMAEEAIRLSKGFDKQAFMLAADGYSRIKDFPKAIDLSKKALKISPDYFDALWILGHTYGLKGDAHSAISPLEKALKLKPDKKYVNTWLGWAYETTGNKEKAIQIYQKALKISPGDKWTREALARVQKK